VKTLKGKERRGSTGSSEDYKKRKREMLGVDGEREEDIFKKSNRVLRSPIRGEEIEGELVRMFKKWREEMKKEMREGMREIKKDIRKIAEEQKEELKREVEGIREKLAVREENWRREREEFRVRLEKLERELKGVKGKKGKEEKLMKG